MGQSDGSYILTKPNAGAGVQITYTNGVMTIGASGAGSGIFNGGRLTLTSNTPVADASAQGTLYWTPYLHGIISLWDGSKYTNLIPGQKSLSLTVTSGSVYDVFGYLSSGTLALEILVWTNTTTRATGLTVDSSGVTHKTGDQTRRWLGTLYASGTNQCTDNTSIRGLFNASNRVTRALLAKDTQNTWTYTLTDYREARGQSTNGVSRFSFVLGDTTCLRGMGLHSADTTVANTAISAIGLDSSTAQATDCINSNMSLPAGSAVSGNLVSFYTGNPGIGLHDLRLLEAVGVATGTTNWYGDAGLTNLQTGLHGVLEC